MACHAYSYAICDYSTAVISARPLRNWHGGYALCTKLAIGQASLINAPRGSIMEVATLLQPGISAPPKRGEIFRCDCCGLEIEIRNDCGCPNPRHVLFECCGQEMLQVDLFGLWALTDVP